MLAYVAIAIVAIFLVVSLLHKVQDSGRRAERITEDYVKGIWDGQFLNLSAPLFSPSDCFWLEYELGFPLLASDLTRARKRLAIQWLKVLKASFQELVRTPEFEPSAETPAPSHGAWRLSWLTIRFYLLITYAQFVVRLFGPYHRLIPTINWRRFFPASSSAQRDLRAVRFGNFE